MIQASKVAQAAVDALGMGITYKQEDCQAFVEQTIKRAGGRYVNYRGSNDMYRNALTRADPLKSKEGKAMLVPGALLFIVSHDGGERQYGYKDSLGNAWHVGIYTGAPHAEVVHSSDTRGGVYPSTLKNAWTHVAWSKHVDYGQTHKEAPEMPGQRILKVTKGQPLLKGDDVRMVQERLVLLGYMLVADGVYGYDTQAAVKDYQARTGLLADGEVGPQTLGALMAAEGAVGAGPVMDRIPSLADWEKVEHLLLEALSVVHSVKGAG